MNDKLDKQFKSLFNKKKALIRIPEIPAKIIPESRSSLRIGFSISFITIIIFCYLSFTLFAFFSTAYEVPLTTICSNFIEEYKLNEKIIEGIFYLKDSFFRNQL